MSDLNVFNCTGRLGADPETKTFNDGNEVVNFRVAVSEQWKSNGERREKTLWLPVKVQNKGLIKLSGYISKGSRVALSGKLESRQYEKDGQQHTIVELVLGPFGGSMTLLDGKSDSDGAGSSSGSSSSSSERPRAAEPPAFESGGDDGIPF